MTDETLSQTKDCEWERLLDPHLSLLHAPDLDGHFRRIDDAPRGFVRADRSIRCIDGRTPCGKHLAGQGILLAHRAGIDYALDTIHNIGADGIYSHERCGAGALYAMLQGLDPSEGDIYAREWSEFAAKKLDIPYHGHIPVDTPFHHEMATYFDGTGRLDPTQLERHLVPGFCISRKYHQHPHDAREELALSIGIAFGKSGFAHRFTPKNPFLIVVIGHPEIHELRAEKLLREAQAVIGSSHHKASIQVLSLTPDTSWLV